MTNEPEYVDMKPWIAERLAEHRLHAESWIVSNMTAATRQAGAWGAVTRGVFERRLNDQSERLDILLRIVELEDAFESRALAQRLRERYDRASSP